MTNYFLFFSFYFLCFSSVFALTDLEQALQIYEQGLQASSFEEQNKTFNQSLEICDQILQQTSPSFFLLHLLGNCYFQLGEYGYAILYYQKALKIHPQDFLVLKNLESVEQILGLSSSFKKPVLLFSFLSSFDYLSFLFWFLLASLLSLCILFNSYDRNKKKLSNFYLQITKKFVSTLWVMTSLIGVVSFSNHFLTPLEAVLIQSSLLYSSPSFSVSSLSKVPLLMGLKIQVLQVDSTNKWVKVQTQTGEKGYLPLFTLQLI